MPVYAPTGHSCLGTAVRYLSICFKTAWGFCYEKPNENDLEQKASAGGLCHSKAEQLQQEGRNE